MTRSRHLALSAFLWACPVGLTLGLVPAETAQTQETEVKKTSITRKSGAVVAGEIKGLVIQGGVVQKEIRKQVHYGGVYYRVQGNDIEAIDAKGVHYRPEGEVRYVVIIQKEPINELAAVEVAVALGDNEYVNNVVEYLGHMEHPAAVSMTPMKLDKPNPSNHAKVLGQYRREDGKGKLIPVLEVTTPDGLVTIPVEDVVDFEEKAGEPGQERQPPNR